MTMNGERPVNFRTTCGLLLAGAVLVFLSCLRPVSRPDIWTHLAEGRAAAAVRATVSDPVAGPLAETAPGGHYRVYNRLAYRIYRTGGIPAVILLHAFLLASAFLLVGLASRQWGGGFPLAPALLVAVWSCAALWSPGPEMVAVALGGLVFFLVSARRPLPWMASLIPLQWIWSSIAPGSILGPLLAAAAGLGWLADARRRGPEVAGPERTYLVAFGGIVAAMLVSILISPGGWGWSVLLRPENNSALHFFPLWGSVANAFMGPSPARHLTTLAFILAASGLITRKDRIPALPAAGALIGAWIAIRSPYQLTWFFLLGFPFLCLSLESLARVVGPRLHPRNTEFFGMWIGRIGTALLALTAILLVAGRSDRFPAFPGRFGLGHSDDYFPIEAARILRERNLLPLRFAYLPHDGGALAWAMPERTLSLNYRQGVLHPEMYALTHKIFFASPQERVRTLREQRITALLVNCAWPGAVYSIRDLLMEGSWGLAYFDGVTALLLYRAAGDPAEIPLLSAQKDGNRILEEDARNTGASIAKGRIPGFRPRLVGGALLYHALGRDAESVPLFDLALQSCPNLPGLRLEYGKSLLRLGRLKDAERELRLGLRSMSRNSAGWRALSQALALQGREAEARKAQDRAQRYAPRTPHLIGTDGP